MQFTVAELIACVDREVRRRRRYYPQWVREGRLSKERAEEEIAKMELVCRLLRQAEQQWESRRAA